MEVKLSPRAAKYFQKLDAHTKERMKKALRKLSLEPPQGDIKAMQGQRNVYRCKVGDWRLLFSIDSESNLIIVNKIAPRGEVYKGR